MNARMPLSSAQKKALVNEVRRQCVEQTEQYEISIDAVFIYTLLESPPLKKMKLGKQRIEQIYGDMFRFRKEMQERYQSSDDADTGIGDFAIIMKLKERGIDIEQMYHAQADSQRFKVKVK